MFRSKKGTDKPIEIFIALFIILAIAMLMLRMFSDQLKEKTEELERREHQQKLEAARNEAESVCSDVCTDALANGCDDASLAKYCIARIPGGLDLNFNGDTDDYVDSSNSQELWGKCESHIYCREIKSCNECGKHLSLKKCTEIVCDWLLSEGLGPDDSAIRAEKAFEFGECLREEKYYEKVELKETWDYKLLDYINCYCGGFSEACALI